MKINMYKALLAGLIAATTLAGCEDERNNFMVDDTLSFVNATQYADVSVYNEHYALAVLKNGKGLQEAKACVEVSPAAMEEYNKAHQTQFVQLPEECYTIANPQVGFPEGAVRKFVEITWKTAEVIKLDATKDYVIPLQLSAANNALKVDENRDVMLINLKRATLNMEKETAAFYPSADRSSAPFEGSIAINSALADMDVTVSYEIDNKLIEAYNKAHATSFTAAPEGFATLDARESQLPAGKLSTKFSGKINSAALFSGNTLQTQGAYLIPIRITGSSLEGVTIEKNIMYITITMDKVLKGPWTVLEGQKNCFAEDPNAPAWAKKYTSDKLFDGEFDDNHCWISSWDNGPIKFPMDFVVDMGKTQVFTKFYISDYTTHQGNLRDYKIYTAEEYKGADTKWNLVASGMRDYAWAAQPAPYAYPVQKYIAGRYLKFSIIKPENPIDSKDYLNGRGKLADVQGVGF